MLDLYSLRVLFLLGWVFASSCTDTDRDVICKVLGELTDLCHTQLTRSERCAIRKNRIQYFVNNFIKAKAA